MKSSSSFQVLLAGLATLCTAIAVSAEPPASELNRPPNENAVQALLVQLASNMVTIPAGRFRMGDTAGTGEPDEKPVHDVSVPTFRMSKYEVTFAQYDTYAKATGKPLPPDATWGRGARPAINVSWDDAQEFIAWLNRQTGGGYRLPTEAEWEYAARAGKKSAYPWGERFNPSLANSVANTGADRWYWTAPVGSLPANAFGLFDMIGNVAEWTQDCYALRYLSSDDPPKHEGECLRVTRGGGWNFEAQFSTVSRRNWNTRGFRINHVGFRLAADP
jgi:formylglycine-generating enzyme required for sulfatase activity